MIPDCRYVSLIGNDKEGICCYTSTAGDSLEKQNEEWKSKWEDKYLKQICGFANSEGGVMKVGVADDGTVVGVADPKGDMKKITDTIANKLSIYPAVHIDETTNVITITVQRSPVPVDLDGKFYIRTGNTTQAATGRVHDLMASRRLNISWSDMPLDGLDISCLDSNAIAFFRKRAIEKKAISTDSLNVSDQDLLIKLNLMTKDGIPTRAAILLFHPNPEDVLRGSSVKVGMFEGTDSPEILYEDFVGGPLITMPDRLCDLINTKYSKKRISYKGLNMVETPPFPEESLREAIINAVMHNDYGSSTWIQIRVWENRIRIDDSGGIPFDWTYEDLMSEHRSVPTNPNLAYVFFLAGFVESWGRGISRIIGGYSGYPGMEPEIKASHYSFTVILKNVNYRQDDSLSEEVSKKDIGSQSLLEFLDCPMGRSSREIAEFTGLSQSSVITRKVKSLIEQGLVERTIPDAISSKNQRYRITNAGREIIG